MYMYETVMPQIVFDKWVNMMQWGFGLKYLCPVSMAQTTKWIEMKSHKQNT